jgi:hypothetical protein
MPITGTETVLSAAVAAEVKAKLLANGGGEEGFVVDNAALTTLCNAVGDGVAKVIAHLIANQLIVTTCPAGPGTAVLS